MQRYDGRIKLSPQEARIVFHAELGEPTKQIAHALAIAAGTVSNTLSRLYRGLEVDGRGQLGCWARQNPGYELGAWCTVGLREPPA